MFSYFKEKNKQHRHQSLDLNSPYFVRWKDENEAIHLPLKITKVKSSIMKAHQETNCTISELHCLFCCLKPKWQYATDYGVSSKPLLHCRYRNIQTHFWRIDIFQNAANISIYTWEKEVFKRVCISSYCRLFLWEFLQVKHVLNLTNSNVSVYLKSWQKSSLWSLTALWQITRMLYV